MDFKEEIIKALRKETNLEQINLEIPPELWLGDFSFPCFMLSKVYKKNPEQIAQELSRKIKLHFVDRIEAKGPYLNFFVKKGILAEEVLYKILKEKENYGKQEKKNKKIVLEFPSPNTNKPLHLGHVRNILLGISLSSLLGFQGYRVVKVNLNNDRGVHICKSMLAYQKFGHGKKPNKKSDHFVGDFYVLFSRHAQQDPKWEEEALIMLNKWEQGDKETLALWKKMNAWAVKGFEETYKKFGLKFDKVYNESSHYQEAKSMVSRALENGLLERDEKWNVVANLEKYNLPNKVVLRSDGTSVYITQDINLAKLKYRDFRFDESFVITGSEQNMHFQQLAKILEIFKFPFARHYRHLSYGMIYLPHGRMKSREGTVVDADDILEEMYGLARKEIEKRYPDLPAKEKEKRAMAIGMAALSFFIMKIDPAKDFVFNPEESISFEGDTGPYLQYTYARICSIFEKYGKKTGPTAHADLLKEKEEAEIVKRLSNFPGIAMASAEQHRPHILANYLLDLGHLFNEFYHKYPVLKAEEELRKARLLLCHAVKHVLGNGLRLLNIKVLERM